MNEWFTVEVLDDDSYVISEYNHWEETHCYLLLGTSKAVLIDTGLGVSNIRDIIDKLTQLPISVITTHAHWDHIGGHHLFEDISIHALEADWLSKQFPLPLQVVKSNLLKEPCQFPQCFNIDTYRIYQGLPTTILNDGNVIDLGNRKLQVFHTPGHSPGHVCLYEESKKYLYSGDLIYTGCLDAFYPTTDPYNFMNSVSRIKDLPLKKLLPAHHSLDISTSLVSDIYNGFKEIYESGRLVQGNGVFEFQNFSIHI